MRGTSDAEGGRGAEESEIAKGERLSAGDFGFGEAPDDQRRCDQQQESGDEDDRHQHGEKNRSGDKKNDDPAVHRCAVRIPETSLRVRLLTIPAQNLLQRFGGVVAADQVFPGSEVLILRDAVAAG